MLCQDPWFALYLDRRRRYKYGLSERELPDGTHNTQDARDWLVAACGITSRAELDHFPIARQRFLGIRQRFMNWKRRQLAIRCQWQQEARHG
ncbi:hypothetical protein HOP57_21485 [Halomonas daqingensis]|nr:hypothetical protein [Halomonas desiderata]MCE8014100.1 hypothetical protein [Halomonas desiderata]